MPSGRLVETQCSHMIEQTEKQIVRQTNMTIYRDDIADKNIRLIQPFFICHYIPDEKLHYRKITEVLYCSTTELLTNTYRAAITSEN